MAMCHKFRITHQPEVYGDFGGTSPSTRQWGASSVSRDDFPASCGGYPCSVPNGCPKNIEKHNWFLLVISTYPSSVLCIYFSWSNYISCQNCFFCLTAGAFVSSNCRYTSRKATTVLGVISKFRNSEPEKSDMRMGQATYCYLVLPYITTYITIYYHIWPYDWENKHPPHFDHPGAIL